MSQPPFPNLHPPTPKTNATTTSTTPTMLGKIRGRTIKILILLENQPSRTVELGENLDYPPHYVWRYLKNLQKYGLAREQDYIWYLTDKGYSFIVPLIKNFNKNENITKSRNELETKSKETRNELETKSKPVFKQASLGVYLSNYSLEVIERGVVEVLVAHFNETQSKFIYCQDQYEMAEKFKCRPDQIIPVMQHLKQDHIAYVYHDRGYNSFKVGLYKSFVELLQGNNSQDKPAGETNG